MYKSNWYNGDWTLNVSFKQMVEFGQVIRLVNVNYQHYFGIKNNDR